MATTKRSGKTVDINVVKFSQGDDWARFEMREDRDVVLFTNSRGVRIPEMSRGAALDRMSALVSGKWDRSVTAATMPAWAV